MSNVFQMYMNNGWEANFWVRRSNWVNTVALVKSVGGMEAGVIPGQPPYFSQPGKGSPKVICDALDARTDRLMDKNAELRCPGNYSYYLIDPPSWANHD